MLSIDEEVKDPILVSKFDWFKNVYDMKLRAVGYCGAMTDDNDLVVFLMMMLLSLMLSCPRMSLTLILENNDCRGHVTIIGSQCGN